MTYSITPFSGYHISDVTVDGQSVGAVDSYTFDNVTDNHTIAVTFARDSGGNSGGGSDDLRSHLRHPRFCRQRRLHQPQGHRPRGKGRLQDLYHHRRQGATPSLT